MIQFTVNKTKANLEDEVVTLEVRNLELQEFVNRQRELQAELQQLRSLLSISEQVQDDKITWGNEIRAVLETLPAQGNSARPNISFDSLTMQAVNPPRFEEGRYEGQSILAEMDVSGTVRNTDILSQFIGALEASNDYGVDFQSASREDDSGLYTYSLTIGALSGGSE